MSLLASLEDRLRQPVADAPPPKDASPRRVQGAVWVTRKGVHVDRIASAWLIKRFIDHDAKLKFVPPKGYSPESGELRFDMFEAEYTHEGDSCTFEVLARRFQISDAAVAAIAEVIHDIDVHDGKFERPETPGVERLINGIALTQPDDEARIALGSQLFDALYEAWRRKRIMTTTPSPRPARPARPGPASGTLRDVLRYFLYLGTFGFGGPIALAGYMQRDLVEKRGWITKKDYVDGLALAQLAPGPLAAQLAIYLGWVKGRVLGATAVAAAFILPSFVMVLASVGSLCPLRRTPVDAERVLRRRRGRHRNHRAAARSSW